MAESRRGTDSRTALGSCPSCEAKIPAGYLLIRYETSEGWPRMFAECPTCRDVVHPS